jgi:choline dehydrogenase
MQAGTSRTDDFNRGDNEGCGFFLVSQTRGVRLNTSRAFLRPVLNRPNLTVLTEAQARRLTTAEDRRGPQGAGRFVAARAPHRRAASAREVPKRSLFPL